MAEKTVAQAVKSFVRARQADGRAPRTIRDYHRVLDRFAGWCGERDIVLARLDRDTVREYAGLLHRQNWADNTVSIHIRTLRAFLNWLFREGLTTENLASCIQPPRSSRRMEEPLTGEEIRALLSVCNGDPFASRDRALILLLADTGLRLGELLRLKRADVRFSEDGSSAYLLVYAPKTRSHRFVFLSSPSTQALREYLEDERDGDSLWIGRFGKLTESGIRGILRRRARQAGLDPRRVHPHAFRKFFATSWIRNGGDTLRLQQIGGWASPKMLEVYVLLAQKQDLEEAHERFSPVSRIFGNCN
jgi:site-specific recombinase XerD